MSRGDLPEDIHWNKIVSNLKGKGWTLREIAYETGFTEGELAQMENELYFPPYLPIIQLLDLHVSVCPEKHRNIGVKDAEL